MVSTLSRGSSKSSTQIKRKWKQSSKSASIPNNPAVLGLSSVSLLRLHLKKGAITMQWKWQHQDVRSVWPIYLSTHDSVTAPEAPGYEEQLSILRGKTNKDLQWLSHYSEGLFSKFSFFPNLKKKKKYHFQHQEAEAGWYPSLRPAGLQNETLFQKGVRGWGRTLSLRTSLSSYHKAILLSFIPNNTEILRTRL